MRRSLSIASALLLLFPMTASAHKMWLLPSETVLAGPDPLITVDAAISNDLFFFNHHALSLDGLDVTAPDGSKAAAENQATLRYRSVFDVPLLQKGTYRIAVKTSGLLATWEEDGERQVLRGTKEAVGEKLPAEAKDLKIVERVGRVETFATNGNPTLESLKATGEGVELVPITHPNDLYAGESARFKLLVDGEPAAGLKVEIIRGGTRYRDAQEEIEATTDAEGQFAVKWNEPGMYWVETTTRDDKMEFPRAEERVLNYAATLEVLP